MLSPSAASRTIEAKHATTRRSSVARAIFATDRAMSKGRSLAIGAVLLLAALVWWNDVFGDLLAPESVQAAVEHAGIWGPVLYMALAAASFVVFLLAPVVWVSVALWPVPEAFAYSFTAALLASLATYALTFALGRDWARQRVPPRLARWEERLEARPVLALVALRALLWANPLVDVLVAVSRVPPRAYITGTLLGLLWPTAFQIGIAAGGGALLNSLIGRV